MCGNLFCGFWKPKSKELKNLMNRRLTIANSYVQLKPSECGEVILINTRFLRANCSYVGFDETELTFYSGDIIEVSDAYTHKYLYFAKHLTTNAMGKISFRHFDPETIFELQPWFFNNISREGAINELLKHYQIGTFLVREALNVTDSIQKYTLSILDKLNGAFIVRHFKINYENQYYYISKEFPDKNLDSLIKHYQDDNDGCLGLHPKLSTPCPKSASFTRHWIEFTR